MRKIAVFTGTRAEYGLLYWVIKGIQESSLSELQLYVGGMHLSPEFGYTASRIIEDGFPITEKMEFLLSSDTPVGIAKSMGLALIGASEALDRNKPDLLVLLGDRFESMALAQAAMLACIPVAHIHGGETTEGLIDEAARHSITKMSHFHFTTTEAYRKRVIQLGEQPNTVFNFGAPGIDSIVKLPLMERKSLSESLGFDVSSPYFMITYHPVTLEKYGSSESLINLNKALELFPNYKCVITYPNADTHGRELIKILDDFKAQNPDRVLLVQSLGQLRYLSLLKYCDAVIGNSSSGLIEAPTFNIPTINIGNRQKGRIIGDTVIQCGDSLEEIKEAIDVAVSPEFKFRCKQAKNPYGNGDSSIQIVDKLLSCSLDKVVAKSFYDFEVSKK
ncbi:UDP-N-acetylglucosamine 2-epimerase [Psychromonas aquimarina]|uniref:UDP-N-acetylglucosamine 2-epimerase n=1 Tax=Psychromonas aquimarina TaxID=444919 RepID=UPI0004175963|nr:UDP-N-acetylglucosamine 2-epimerase [Psychromonas aquimarina]